MNTTISQWQFEAHSDHDGFSLTQYSDKQEYDFYVEYGSHINEQERQNIRSLIEAAPQLLHALNGLIDYVRRDGVLFHNLNEKELAYILKDANAAIAKATP